MRDERIETEKKASNVTKKKTEKAADLSIDFLRWLLINETEHLLIWNKPAHLLIHPWDKHTTDLTLHDYMMSYLKQTNQRNATETYTPSMCYRLDKDTSWVVISAKTYIALQYMNKIIRERKTEKWYTAVLAWDIRKKIEEVKNKNWKQKSHRPDMQYTVHEWRTWITVTAPLFVWYNRSRGRSQSFVNNEKWKESITTFFAENVIHHPILWIISLVKVKLWTGRMHQIRVHAAHMWTPILWDLTYWNPAINRKATKKCQLTRQLLHASTYWFFDIFSDTYTSYESSLPGEFLNLFSNDQ